MDDEFKQEVEKMLRQVTEEENIESIMETPIAGIPIGSAGVGGMIATLVDGFIDSYIPLKHRWLYPVDRLVRKCPWRWLNSRYFRWRLKSNRASRNMLKLASASAMSKVPNAVLSKESREMVQLMLVSDAIWDLVPISMGKMLKSLEKS